MGKTCKKYLLLPIVSALFLSGCAAAEKEIVPENISAQRTDSTTPENETTSPQIVFEGEDINGNTVSSAVFADAKLTMVNVWATYCNPCLREMPGLGELAGEYASEDFQIIGIISDVQTDANPAAISLAENLIAQTGADYPHLLLNESLYYALLTDVMAVPTTFFINSEGEILDTVIGSMEKSAWEEKINALLEEQ